MAPSESAVLLCCQSVQGISLRPKAVIAIVDDDQSAREGMVDLVTAMGFHAEAFERAEDFLEFRCQPDCLITDVRMRGMSGLQLIERLLASGRSVPTIVVTAFAQEADRARALHGGAICCLSKPFEETQLLECIRATLSSPGRARDDEVALDAIRRRSAN
jgi:FixJ family two-component response regulator